ncbi:oxidoreductase [Bacteroidia bacterium]|nr:oxidoreductase [Bacteroidia bacterium]GHU57142.1 oxidoreductase [Bacteroidia bacterium]
MAKMNRRNFIKTGVAGVASLSVAGGMANANNVLNYSQQAYVVDKVQLGNSGLIVPRIAMGTGSSGFNRSSKQTRSGIENFVKVVHRAYERGASFYDMADAYGSHTFVGEAIKTLPREKLTLLSKMTHYPPGSPQVEPVRTTLDRFRKEIGTDYLDILLIHYLTMGGWNDSRKHYVDGFLKAKQDGILKAIGVSCHSYDALIQAAETPWVDVIMARINPFQTRMDGTPDAIVKVLELARKNGKGLIGMKIFGDGANVSDPEREQSIKYALTQSNIHCMTLGLENVAQVDDAVDRVMRLAKG